MLSPALRALRAALPASKITLMTSAPASLLAPLLPWIDDVLIDRTLAGEDAPSRLLDPRREAAFVERLRERAFSLGLIFTSFARSPLPAAYACYLAGIPYRVGLTRQSTGSLLSHALPPPPDDLHQVDRNLALLEAVGIPPAGRELELEIPQSVERAANEQLQQAGLKPGIPYVVMAPGSGRRSDQYDPAHFAAAAHILSGETEWQLIVAGGSAESIQPVLQVADENLYGNVYSLVGKAALPELAAIIRHASLTISNRSVAMQLAEAFGGPLVVLYPETDRVSEWMPRHSPARLLGRPTACSPCQHAACPYGINCLEVRPEEVAIAALELLTEHACSPSAAARILRHPIELKSEKR